MRKSPYLLENFNEFKSFGFDNWTNIKSEGALKDDQTEARHFDYNKQKQLLLQNMQKNNEKIICEFCKSTFEKSISIQCKGIILLNIKIQLTNKLKPNLNSIRGFNPLLLIYTNIDLLFVLDQQIQCVIFTIEQWINLNVLFDLYMTNIVYIIS